MKKKIERDIIRGLLVAQKGRCAITGEKITPLDVTLDHIIPVSRKDLENSDEYGEVWLVSKKVNAMKSTMMMDDLYEMCEKILRNKDKANKLKKMIINKEIKKISKKEFDEYIKQNYKESGEIKEE